MDRRFVPALWAALLAAGAALHFWGLSRKALWYDEITTAVYAAKPVGELWTFLATREVHPPLFFYVAKLSAALPLAPEWSLRLVPLLAALACIPLAETIARRAFGVRYWGALLAAFFPGLVFYGQEARAYAPLVAAQFLAVYALVRLREAPQAWRFVVLAVAALWAAAGLHYFAILFALPLAAALVLWSGRRRFALAALTVGAALYAPWIPVAYRTFFGTGDLLQHAEPRTLTPGDYFGLLAFLWGGAWATAAVLVASGAAAVWAVRDSLGRLLVALIVFTPAFLTAMPPTYPYFPARYVIAWAALPILLMPALLGAAIPRPARLAAAGVLAFVAAMGLIAGVAHGRTTRDWNRALAADFGKYFANGDVLVVSPYYQSLALEYYLPLDAKTKTELLSDPLKNYDGARLHVGDRTLVVASPRAMGSVLSNRKGLSGNMWFLQYGPLDTDTRAWNDVMIPIVRWPDATLHRITAGVLVNPRSKQLYLGSLWLGPYQPVPKKPLP